MSNKAIKRGFYIVAMTHGQGHFREGGGGLWGQVGGILEKSLRGAEFSVQLRKKLSVSIKVRLNVETLI